MTALASATRLATVQSYCIPTERPESDGTLEWDHTSLVVVEVAAGGAHGLGYSYTHPAAASVIAGTLGPCIDGRAAGDVPEMFGAMVRAVRNIGRPGIAAAAISAVDAALWDLKATLLGVALCDLLGTARDAVPVYGSGGFTSYSEAELTDQLAGWADRGFRAVKMKIGRVPGHDGRRVAAARSAIGPDVALFVDANGGYTRKQALRLAPAFSEQDVTWFEEPVSSDDLDGLRLVRDRAPAGMDIAAGEYGYDVMYFERMVSAGAVDVLQADATRCGGVTGFLAAAEVARSHGLLLSAHCAPAIHCHVGAAVSNLAHLEYFHDHVRIERLLFDGTPEPRDGVLVPDRSRAGSGLVLKQPDAERYAA